MLPLAPAAPSFKVPAVMEVPPLYVMEPVRVVVPAPC
jgi:hypothetical protein